MIEEQAQKVKEDPNARLYHCSIIHLVIGTFPCSHNHFDFGIECMFKAFNPMHAKLNAVFELVRSIAWPEFILGDVAFDITCQFLDDVDKNGKKMESIIDMTMAVEDAREHQTIRFEARTLEEMLHRLYSF
jgi:hypothetical protein